MRPMRRAIRVWCVVTVLGLAVVGPGALVAAVDDGPGGPSRPSGPSDPSGPGPTGRPTRTVLRPTELAQPAPRKPSAKEVIIVVSGVNSSAQDPTFDALRARIALEQVPDDDAEPLAIEEVIARFYHLHGATEA